MALWIATAVSAFLLGLSKAGLPVFAILTVPIMALFMEPAKAAGLLLPLYIVADMYTVYLFRGAYSLRIFKIMMPSALIGITIGFFAISSVSSDAVKLMLALIGLGYLANSLRIRLGKKDVEPKPANLPKGVFWGSLSGFTSYIAHAGGPPFQAYILPQKLDKMTFLGTWAMFFAFVNMAKLPPYILAGQINFQSLGQAVWLIPFALIGVWSGAYITRILPEKAFFALIEIALGLVSLKLLWDVFGV